MKKIVPIVSLSIIGLLIITILIMFFAPASHACEIHRPEEIQIYINSSNEKTISADYENREYYDTVMNKLDESFKERALTALFNGRLGQKAELKETSGSITMSNGVYVVLSYNNNAITYKNGNNKISAVYVAFELVETSGFESVNAYLIEKEEDVTSTKMKYHYYYSMQGDTKDLYDYVKNNLYNAL